MDARAAQAAIAAGALALDVREQVEWDAGHIAGAVHVPLGELCLRYEELPRDRDIVCICRSGARSAQATAVLAGAGYRIENLDPGMRGWVAAGLPIEPSDGHVV
jgi:rhodanese-related sulfurtransferase